MKKIISVFLSVFIMISAVTASNVSATAETEGDWEYSVSDQEVCITKYTGYENDVVIPSQLGGLPVTSIGDCAFKKCDRIVSVVIPDGVKTIGNGAFEECVSLVNITIPNSVTYLGSSAFSNCENLTGNITIPYGVENIYYQTFNQCEKLTSVTLPNSVTYIGDNAFFRCNSLTDINIPDSVKTIGKFAFYGCSFTSITIPDGITSIKEDTFLHCRSLTSVNIPNSVTNIEKEAFAGCSSLININVPDSVKIIGEGAFASCSSLININVPDSVKIIGEDAFHNTAYYKSSNNWQDDMLYLGDRLIDAKEYITDYVKIREGTRFITDCAFKKCKELIGIAIPESVEYIGLNAFVDCKQLRIVNILSHDAKIEFFAFPDNISYTIRCLEGSTAEEYAKKKGVNYETVIFSLHDEANIASIEYVGSDTFDKDTKFVVQEITDGDLMQSIQQDFPDKVVQIYNFSFENFNKTEESLKEYLFSLTANKKASPDNCKLYLESNGHYSVIPFEYEGGKIKFTTVFLGNYVIVKDKYGMGDVDGNGCVNTTDALTVLQSCVDIIELDEQQFKAADVDSSGDISSYDALKILQFTVEMIDNFSAQQ